MNNDYNFNGNKIMQVSNDNVTVENNTINDPFAHMNKNNDDKKLKWYKIALYVCIIIIFILFFYSLIVSSIKKSSKSVEVQSKENLENVALELVDYIDNYHLDSMDLYGPNELLRIAINDICYGVIRNTPGCCGNDGLAGLDIRYDGEYPELKTWVEVIGVVGKDISYDEEIPAIQVTSIREKEEGTTFVTN